MSHPANPQNLRTLYRHFLRELPSRRPSLLANPSPLHQHIRAVFVSGQLDPASDSSFHSSPPIPSADPTTQAPSSASNASEPAAASIAGQQLQSSTGPQVIHQFLQYVRAQRTYLTLVERYNPGMNMSEEERVRLSARRVGLNLPPELLESIKKGGSGGNP